MSICLNADAIRDEISEGETLTGTQTDALLALPDKEFDAAINEVVHDDFWLFFDQTRSDAIRWLLKRHALGDEGEEF